LHLYKVSLSLFEVLEKPIGGEFSRWFQGSIRVENLQFHKIRKDRNPLLPIHKSAPSIFLIKVYGVMNIIINPLPPSGLINHTLANMAPSVLHLRCVCNIGYLYIVLWTKRTHEGGNQANLMRKKPPQTGKQLLPNKLTRER
jgi:hypothetical protein